MYSRIETSKLKKEFWTAFGSYMKPIKNTEGNHINWINYKTGVKGIYFRMDASRGSASIAIEIKNSSSEKRLDFFEIFKTNKTCFSQILGEAWQWQKDFYDIDGNTISRVSKEQRDVNVIERDTWPIIISFLKERIIKLDTFWNDVKFQFDGF